MHAVSPSIPPAVQHMPDMNYPRDRFMRLPEVIHTCGLSRSTIYDLISRQNFPAQISLGGKNVAWLASEIDGWVQSRVAARYVEVQS